MICPRCAQGEVLRVRVNVTEETACICDECDALWHAGVDISNETWVDFGTYMQQLNHRGIWDELEVLPEQDAVMGS